MGVSAPLHHRLRNALGLLLTSRAAAASARCVACCSRIVSEHTLGMSGAPWVLCFKLWPDGLYKRDSNA